MKKQLFFIFFCFGIFGSGFSQQTKFYRTYGEGVYNSGQAVLQDYADSGYVVCGGINEGNGNGLDVLIFKTDSMGVQQWRKSIGGPGIDFAKHFCHSPGGAGYTMAGYTNRNGSYDGLLVATDLNGDTLWTKVYGGPDWDMLYSIDTTYDGGYVVAGETYSFGSGNSDAWVMKLNAVGDTLWTRAFGGNKDDNARWVFEVLDSNIAVIGSTNSFGAGKSDVYIVYLDETGDTLWTRTIGTALNEYGYSGDMYFDVFGNVSLMTGGTKKHDTEPYTAFYNSRVTTTGSVLFTQEGNLADQHVRDYTRLKNEGNSGKFYIAYQLKYSFQTNWNVEFNRTYYAGVFGYVVEPLGTSDHDDYNYDILKTSDYGYIMVGESVGLGPNNASCYLLKVDSMGATVTAPLVGMEDPATTLEFSVYPNPFAGQVYITGLQEYPDAKIELMDITGKVCLLRYAQGQNSVLDLTSFSGGIYFIRVTAGASTAIRKLVRQ